ncbi:flagellar biosynthesis protein FlhF [Cohnella faecalis]|uniref:Flagellar biosynthesis protein FlhF n=1 Tax=Cohnella faecalis TaxID=2315694 RepID=A0A398CVR0_9BACL|nr:flagellar biosynthesis protein FlhF [Cohnella faecalis]RIE03301.1 flagellar biosynthesis protein FlhF [Cohnella faecalis]
MKVKRYVVDDLPQAVQMIRSELGSDAVILNTKEIRTGGFLGMFRKKRVEVIAAIDEASRKPAPRPAAPTKPIVRKSEPSEESAIPAVQLPNAAVRERYARSTGTSDAPAVRTSAVPSAASAVAVAVPAESPSKEAPERGAFAVPDDPRPARPVQAGAGLAENPDTASLLTELRSMKEMMVKLSKQQTFRSMPDSVMNWSRRLAEQGVEAPIIERFAEEVNDRLGTEGADDESAALSVAREVLLEWLLPSAGSGINSSTRIVHFVGPTGVGKTTTIAKIAADQSLTHHRTVGLITSDTYRIAAVDQLRTYADILNLPLEVVFSPSEAQRAFKKFEDRDLVLMDTAGRNYRNELLVSEVNSMLSPGEHAETILVLSMTQKYGDMKSVASQFAKYGVTRLLLTKVDETDSYGSILNLALEYSFAISYITCGQTVPDDIRPFDPNEWVSRLLGEPAYA